MSNGQSHTDDPFLRQQRQQHAKLQAKRQQQMAQRLNEFKAQYVAEYKMHLSYPAQVEALDDGNDGVAKSKLRSDRDFINARLLEAGLPLGGGVPDVTPTSPSQMTLFEHSEAATRFVHDLEGTGCYDSVQVFLGNSTNGEGGQTGNAIDVTVKLKEKNWYKLYVGGGVNSEDLSSLGDGGDAGGLGSLGVGGSLPKLQFETSASLLNITGFADVSTASYSVDQTGASSFKFIHDRPLCSWLPKQNALYDWLMPRDPSLIDASEREQQRNTEMNEHQVFVSDDAQYSLGGGSHTTFGVHALVDELDHESTRSCKEFTRTLGLRLANHCRGAARGPGVGGANRPSVSPPESMAGPYLYLDWSVKLRDLLPRRHTEFPFALDCSKEVASQSGTTFKHSLTGGMYLNGCFTDDRYDPTMGYDAHLTCEVAGPPGDVGFCKVKGGASWHWPLELLKMFVFGVSDEVPSNEENPVVIGATIHSSFNAGVIQQLSFSGLCNNSSYRGIPLSDKFYVGGPGQLRGFLPAGIGPRASKGGATAPGGDSLGGDLFYTSTLAASVPFPKYFSAWRQNGGRIFGFANAGTCVSTSSMGGPLMSLASRPALSQIMQSSRIAVGGGVSLGLPMGRFEATYAVPVRFGPRDARKSLQFGFGFSFG